jgi:enoyl-CoA hydratase/carnithine racemase
MAPEDPVATNEGGHSPVARSRHGRVEVLRIDREHARNAIDGPTSQALGRALDELTDDDDVWAVVVTGTGERAFCAGMDLKAFVTGDVATIASTPGGFAGIAQRDFPKPLIAAVNGAALAGGCEIVLACDLVVAAEHATFGVPEVTRGLVAAAGGMLRLPRRLPWAVAMELLLTGAPIDARRAYELGFVNQVVPAAELLEAALALAGRICANAPLAVRRSKQVARAAVDLSEPEAWKLNAQVTGEIFASHDALEGAMAFGQKRPPEWTGA